MKVAIILFNLGGPDSPEAVRPFLQNMFSDPAIIRLPWALRAPLARFAAKRRAPVAQAIYAHIGGRSPILEETRKQADALEAKLAEGGLDARAFIAMRYWHPFSDGAALAAKAWGPDRIVLLPLYPQFSTTTTASSVKDWRRAARKVGLDVPTTDICCYFRDTGFVTAMAGRIHETLGDVPGDAEVQNWRLLLSAHGLPEKIVRAGDPYPWQVEQSAAAIVDKLGIEGLETQVCYQSRVGPLKWIGPATDTEIRRAGRDGKKLVVAPLAFVSEHSETLVELDIEYGKKLAGQVGIKEYRRVPVVGTHPAFIAGLAGLVRQAVLGEKTMARSCPAGLTGCGRGTDDSKTETA